MIMGSDPPHVRRIVIKVGSSVLSGAEGLKPGVFARLAAEVSGLRGRGVEAILVSSGAIAAAMGDFGAARRPEAIPEKQAFAAYGQPLLMKHYISAFGELGLKAAQILLTQSDLEHRGRFLNARHALEELLRRGIVPVINENDTVAVDELKFGDNDRLSAFVANLAGADLLVILSHVDGLYSADPSRDPGAVLVPLVERIDARVRSLVFRGDNIRGTGGMASKLDAAGICGGFGIPVFITNGNRGGAVTGALDGSVPGTWFAPAGGKTGAGRSGARKAWIGAVLKPKGILTVDAGAVAALVAGKKSLLPSGIQAVTGRFERGECVEITDPAGRVIAKGLAKYSAAELERIRGCKSGEIAAILGSRRAEEAVNRDDLVVLDTEVLR